MSRSVLVILAQGAEEMETVITVDVLRRGGVTVTLAGLEGSAPVLCSRNVTVVPDISLEDALNRQKDYQAIILPGGLGGAERLSKSLLVGEILKEQEKSGRIVAAICAAPTTFLAHGVALGRRITSYPSVKIQLVDKFTYVDGEAVVVDGNIVTSRGPGTAFAFGLKLVELLVDKVTSDDVAEKMMLSKC